MIPKMKTSKSNPSKKNIRIEAVALALGYLNIIAAIACVVICVLLIGYGGSIRIFSYLLVPWDRTVSMEQINEDIRNFYDKKQMDDYLFEIFTHFVLEYIVDQVVPWLLAFAMTIYFVFSLILVSGIHKRSSDCIKTFFLFGMITLPMFLLITIICIITFMEKGLSEYLTPHLVILMLIVYYAIQLSVVYRTYQKVKQEEQEYAQYTQWPLNVRY